MSRLLFLIVIAVAVYVLVKSYRKNLPPEDKSVTDDMVKCAHCGVHLPKGESLVAQGQFFCSAAHRDAYSK
ncbi:MAG TPA: PP0621 family protein [Gallionella sp.]|nr:PP0621 family protein [Gallionella sp.]